MHTVKIVLPDATAVAPSTFPAAVDAAQEAGVMVELEMLGDDDPIFRHLANNLRAVLEAA